MIKVALTNLKKYNEEVLEFDWLELSVVSVKPILKHFGDDEFFISDYDEEYEKLQHKLKQCEEVPEERDLQPLKKFLESDFRTMYDSLKKEEKRSMWRSIIKRMVVHDYNNIDVEFL